MYKQTFFPLVLIGVFWESFCLTEEADLSCQQARKKGKFIHGSFAYFVKILASILSGCSV